MSGFSVPCTMNAVNVTSTATALFSGSIAAEPSCWYVLNSDAVNSVWLQPASSPVVTTSNGILLAPGAMASGFCAAGDSVATLFPHGITSSATVKVYAGTATTNGPVVMTFVG